MKVLGLNNDFVYVRRTTKHFKGTKFSIKSKIKFVSRIHLDRLQNKFTNCKGVNNNTNCRQIAGIQEKLDTTYK
jgi:hypothetical protein